MSLTALRTSAPLSFNDLDSQQQSAITQIYEKNTLLIAQAGFGKTVVAQTAGQELIDDEVIRRLLIFAPLKVCQLTWQNEWREWEHLRQPTMAIGDAKTRTAAVMDTDAEIVVMNHENLAWFFQTFGKNHTFDGLIIDEGSKLKLAGGAAMKKLRHRIKDFVWRCVMSATPVHESGVDIYTQMMIVDGGKALGTRQEKFRREYFMQMDFKGYKWKFQPGGLERLSKKIAPSVFVADTEKYEAELPELDERVISVSLPRDAWEHYDAMCSKLLTEVDGEKVEARNLAVSVGKLQQICCGALYDKQKKAQWLHHAKFTELKRLLEHSLEPGPVVIVYQYIYEREMLKDMFGDKAMVLGDHPVEAEALWNTGTLPYLLVHPKSAGHGLNIQRGGFQMVCLAPLWSADSWDQLVRRLRRRGQPSPVVRRYTLCVPGSIEEDILWRQDVKQEDAALFINHLREHAG